MRKKRLRGGQREQQTTAVPERTARVRNRLVASVTVVSLTVAGAGAFGIADVLRDRAESQRLAAFAKTDSAAVALAHSLADERDAMTVYAAAGRGSAPAVPDAQRARVDRQIEEFGRSAPASVRELLDGLPEVRRKALAGPGDALTVFTAYTAVVQALHGVSGALVHRLPARAAAGDAAALPPLGRAVEEASATRGLLLAALASRGHPELGVAAQQSALRERSALADFRQLAGADTRDAYARAVGGPGVADAAALLDHLVTAPPATAAADAEGARAPEEIRTALTTRIEAMRGVESGLATDAMARLARLRTHDLEALEVRSALAALCFLLTLGTGIAAARSVTRPLSALRRGARRVCAEPLTRDPVAVKGRDDEFAEIARSVNVLHGTVVRQRERMNFLEGERTRLDGARRDMAEERDTLRTRHQELADRLSCLTGRIHATVVNLSLRTLGLVERQLSVIESLEAHEADPDRLAVLFKLDHLATRMRRHNENLLVLAGAEHGGGHTGSVPLLDVLRAAVSEIERYERVRIHSLPARSQLVGFAADDVSHLVAELLENATAFSPPDVQVQVSGWLLENGEVMLSVQDEGIGMSPERLEELNSLLAQPDPDPGRIPMGVRKQGQGPGQGDETSRPVMGLGLYVVARLAARHGVRVKLREQRPGGITAVVVLPAHLLPADAPAPDPAAAPPVPGAGTAPPRVNLPGAVAEANSHTLPGRSLRTAETAHRSPVHATAPDDSEQTMEIRAVRDGHRPPPGRHARPGAPAPRRPAEPVGPAPAPEPPAPRPVPPPREATGNGLPKRTPKAVAQKPVPLSVRHGVDAEALRRKLAGFQQGARDGRRDVEAELTERDIGRRRTGASDDGGTVEEARG
ncbi:nitrate- and nitrite sensing domain-containing protein [Streptomyces sp. NPDC001404]|uniref:sensor histidine kinase n=1 Tax=Streptomyces sp. NPDC001404 TaxID=3364571 RepID=UPI0036B100BC